MKTTPIIRTQLLPKLVKVELKGRKLSPTAKARRLSRQTTDERRNP